MSQHRNGHAIAGQISGVPGAELRLGGPGFSVAVLPADSGDGISLGVSGTAAPEQVLRLCARHGLLKGNADRIVAMLDTSGGRDRYEFTGDMKHRLLFSRSWNRDGRAAVMYGLNPIVGDTEGDPDRTPNRKTLANAVGMLSHGGRLARIDVLNVFTLRTAAAAGLPKESSSRVADPQLERDVLTAADAVLLAWGADGAGHPSAIADLAALLDELGIVPKVPSKAGQLLVSGSPAQPMHPRVTGYREVRLVDAPDGWHHGLPADESAGVAVRTASAADLARFGVQPDDTATPSAGEEPTEQSADNDEGAIGQQDLRSRTTNEVSNADHPADTSSSSWAGAAPPPLLAGLTAAGLGDATAQQVGVVIRDWHNREELSQTVAALMALLRGEVPILLDGGETEASLTQILPRLLRTTRDPEEIVQSLAAGAICSGAVGEYASFLECTRPDAPARHKDRPPRWPIPGLNNPADVRLAYARLAGYSGSDDSEGTRARGDGRTMQSSSYPQPAERYGWSDR